MLILVLSLAIPIAGVIGFAMQLRQVKKTRLENKRLRREIAALREDVTNYQTLVSSIQSSPGIRIEPVLGPANLPLEITARTEDAANADHGIAGASNADLNVYAFSSVPIRPASAEAKSKLPYTRTLPIAQAAIVCIGCLVLVAAAVAIFYLLSN